MNGLSRRALQNVVPRDVVLPDEEAVRWSVAGGACPLVLAPVDEEQVAGIMEKASREGWRVRPAGAGTWMQGGGRVDTDLVVSTVRLRRIEAYEPADLTFTSDAGVILADLGGITESHNQWLPLDPPGGGKGTLGAAVAVGAGGPLRQAYGMPRDHVLGLTVVSGDGRVLKWGGKVVKNVAGFDVTRLAVGSWGTIGIITSVSARLFPRPEMDVTLILGGERASELLPAAEALGAWSLPLAALELHERMVMGKGESEVEGGSLSRLLVRLMGSREEVAEVEGQILERWSAGSRALGGGNGEATIQLRGGVRRREGEESRLLHAGLAEWEDRWDLVLRMALLPSHLSTLLREAEELGAMRPREDGDPGVWGLSAHSGVGLVRVGVAWGPSGFGDVQGWADALLSLRARLEERGGSLVVSHGPPALVEAVGAWGSGDTTAHLLGGLRKVFDPGGILVPGRFAS